MQGLGKGIFYRKIYFDFKVILLFSNKQIIFDWFYLKHRIGKAVFVFFFVYLEVFDKGVEVFIE